MKIVGSNSWNPQYKSLDHWRGIAALWVMVFHGFGGIYDKSLHPIVEQLKSLAAPGWLGVHLFFVISGYCIAASVYRLILNNGSSWKFIQNRFRRLMPTYWLAFLLTIILNIVPSPFYKVNIWNIIPTSLQSWIGNLFLIQPYLNVPFYVVVYWSLVVEIGFYCIVFLILLIEEKINLKTAIITGLLLGIISILIPEIPQLGFLTFWSEFVCGFLVFIALFAKHQNHQYYQMLSLLLILIFGTLGILSKYTLQNNQVFFAAIFSIILYCLYFYDNEIDSIVQIKWLKWIGLISYSLYLLHIPFQARVINLGFRFIRVDSPMILFLQILGWIVAISASYIFYKFIEKPLNDLRK